MKKRIIGDSNQFRRCPSSSASTSMISPGKPSSEYRLALWEKLGQPILTLAMILLAVPFTFSAPRSPGMGSRLAVGVIVGLLTWISYQIMVNLGFYLR